MKLCIPLCEDFNSIRFFLIDCNFQLFIVLGDAMLLAKYVKESGIGISEIEELGPENLLSMAKYCKISTNSKSNVGVMLQAIWIEICKHICICI